MTPKWSFNEFTNQDIDIATNLNTIINDIDLLLYGISINNTTTIPPVSPASGDVYIVDGDEYIITAVSTVDNSFTVAGDQSSKFTVGKLFIIRSGIHQGSWTVVSSTYTTSTKIIVVQAIGSATVAGTITIANGVWNGHVNDITIYLNGSWRYISPVQRTLFFDIALNDYIYYEGNSLSWVTGVPVSAHTHSLVDITDVTATAGEINLLDLGGLTAGQVLQATTATTAAWQGITAGSLPTAIDAAKIADGSVSNIEFEYLDGVTSAIQTQIDSKAAKDRIEDTTADTFIDVNNVDDNNIYFVCNSIPVMQLDEGTGVPLIGFGIAPTSNIHYRSTTGSIEFKMESTQDVPIQFTFANLQDTWVLTADTNSFLISLVGLGNVLSIDSTGKVTFLNNISHGGITNYGSKTQAQINALTPVEGDIVYNSTTKDYEFYNGSNWNGMARVN